MTSKENAIKLKSRSKQTARIIKQKLSISKN